MTPRFGVLGHPVAHSLSPAIHRTFYRRHAIDATYEPVDVPAARFPDFLTGLARGTWRGLNVTFPYKRDIANALTELDPLARELEAVNTLVPLAGTGGLPYRGHNTDGEGFCLFLERELGLDVRALAVVMLGAGSSAKSVLAALARRSPRRLTVANRSAKRFEERIFAGLARSGVALETFGSLEGRWGALLSDADVLVHATPFGLSGHAGSEALPEALHAHLTDRPVVVDLNYRKSEPTPFLRSLRPGVRSHDGRGMLLYQAAEAFRLWFGFLPDCTGMLSGLAGGTGSEETWKP